MPYTPSQNYQESVWRLISKKLNELLDTHGEDWHYHINELVESFNNTILPVIGCTPNQAWDPKPTKDILDQIELTDPEEIKNYTEFSYKPFFYKELEVKAKKNAEAMIKR